MSPHWEAAVWSWPLSSNSCKASKSLRTSAGNDGTASLCACLLKYEYEWLVAGRSSSARGRGGRMRGANGDGGGVMTLDVSTEGLGVDGLGRTPARR